MVMIKTTFLEEEESKNIKDKKQEAVLGKSWRDLIPVIKLEVSSVNYNIILFCQNHCLCT